MRVARWTSPVVLVLLLLFGGHIGVPVWTAIVIAVGIAVPVLGIERLVDRADAKRKRQRQRRRR